MTAREYGIKCIQDEANALLELIPKMDEEFDRAVELMFRCHGKIIVTGVGKSGHVGAKIAATLSSTGTPSFFINPLDVFHGDLGVMTSDDVVLAISNSGQTDELLRFIPMVLHHRYERQPRLAAGKVCQLSSERQRTPRSRPHEPGSYQ